VRFEFLGFGIVGQLLGFSKPFGFGGLGSMDFLGNGAARAGAFLAPLGGGFIAVVFGDFGGISFFRFLFLFIPMDFSILEMES
jgi:hypothetical protein